MDVLLKSLLPADAFIFTNQEHIGAHRSNYLPQEQWQLLYGLYQRGIDNASLARQFGISVRAVQYGIHHEKVRRGLSTRKVDRQ